MVSKRNLNSAELGDHEDIEKSPTMVMTASGEVQTREEGTENVKELDLSGDGYASWRNSRSSFSREALRGSWVYLPLGPAVKKTHLTKKWHEDWLQYVELCAIRGSWFINELLYNAHIPDFFIIDIAGSDIFIAVLCIWRQQIRRKCSTRKKWKYEWGVTEKPAA